MAANARNEPEIRQPGRRKLQTFAFDPMTTRLTGRFLHVDVRSEPDLKPGPLGELVHVVDYDAARQTWYRPVDLDDPAILAQGGLQPREADPRTHQQVVYAVAMSVIERFERFLGRRFRWRADRALRLVPHAFEGRNAFFDPDRRAVLFGYYRADKRDPGANLPGQLMFTCLSTDIVAHEVTHAVVHRLRRYFSEGTNADVLAWHEAFADLIALFHHFAYPEVVAREVAKAQGDLAGGGGLLELAREFGESTGRGRALRAAIEKKPSPEHYQAAMEAHERGACFVAAVFDAYLETYKEAIADLLRIATGGTGELPPGSLHPDLVDRVAREAVRNAERFLGMVVRAFDYLPVVDVTFGDVVRAIVTADRALYPDDESNLRRVLVESLRRRGIFPQSVESLADASLALPGPTPEDLAFTGGPPSVDFSKAILSATRDLDPTGEAGTMPSEDEDASVDPWGVTVAGQKIDIGPDVVAWAREHAVSLGLDPAWPISLLGIHVAYRQAADRQPRPEIVLQLAQRREDLEDQRLPEEERVPMRAGTTVVASVDGKVDYVVAKPLPFADLDNVVGQKPELADVARRHHSDGAKRLKDMRDWLDQLDDTDALSAWTAQPSMRRLTFANLHAVVDDFDEEDEKKVEGA